MNDLDLPPYDPIPDDVRDRLRRTVQSRIRRPRRRTPLLVAAGVAVVAAATAIVFTPSDPAETPAEPPIKDVTLTRCAEAVKLAGKAASFPDPTSWQPVLISERIEYSDLVVLGIAAGSQRFFCETTQRTVTVTDPNATRHFAAGGQTAALMLTPSGSLAGVIDPSWPSAMFHSITGASVQFAQQGMFIYSSGGLQPPIMVRRTEYRDPREAKYDQFGGVDLPSPEPPALSVVDRPGGPIDRESDLGKAFGSCLAQTTRPTMDSDSYNPAVRTRRPGGGELIIARSPGRLGACYVNPRSGGPPVAGFATGPRPAVTGKVAFAFYPGSVNGGDGLRSTLGGSLPPGTARMEIRFGNGTTAIPEVANDAFALFIPDQVQVDPGGRLPDEDKTTVKLYGASGAMTYEGQLRFWQPPRRR